MSIHRTAVGVLFISIAWYSTSPALAASFNCDKAASAVEKKICADEGLSDLDEKLAQVYANALATHPKQELVKSQQRGWLRERNNCGGDKSCLERRYVEQIVRLQNIDDNFAYSGQTDIYWMDPSPAYEFGTAHAVEPYATPKDPNVCKTYLKSINYFALQNTPMSCSRPIAPNLAEIIKKVEWLDLDPDKYDELFTQLTSTPPIQVYCIKA